MMKLKYILFMILTAILVACSPSPESISVTPAADNQVDASNTNLPTMTEEYVNTQTSFTYVALGDSIPSCWTANTECYTEIFSSLLQKDLDEEVKFLNLAVAGDRTEHLLNHLRNDPETKSAVAEANLITIWIMGNDLGSPPMLYKNDMCGGDDNLDCIRERVDVIITNITSIFDEIEAINSSEDLQIMIAENAIPPYAMIEWKNWGIFDVMKKEYFEPLQSHIVQIAEERDLIVVRTYLSINGPTGDLENETLYIEDGIHFNTEGNRLIADLHFQAWKEAR